MTRRRRINTRVLHVEEIDNIKYVCKGIPETGIPLCIWCIKIIRYE